MRSNSTSFHWPVPILSVFAAISSPMIVLGQSFEMNLFNPLSANANGIHLYTVNFSTIYSSGAYGIGLPGLRVRQDQSNIVMTQGSAAFGWAARRDRSNFSIRYSPSYARAANLSGFNSLNHSLDFLGSAKLAPKVTLGVSFRGIVSDFSQLLFSGGAASSIVSTQASFDEISAALMSRKSDNIRLSEIVSSPAIVGSPEVAYLYGSRELSASAGVTLGYEQSTRSSFGASLYAVRTQFLNDSNKAFGAGVSNSIPLIPRTTSATGSLTWSYSVTPRTTLAASITSNRVLSRYNDGFTTHQGVSLGHQLSTKWFVRGSAGAGTYIPTRETVVRGNYTQHEFGGGVGYKLYSHTFVGSYDRSVSDLYGLGANATITSSGAWAWKQPGRSISLSSSIGYSEFTGSRFANGGSLSAFGGFSKAVDSHFVFSVAMRYNQFPNSLFLASPGVSQVGVVASVSWSPSERR